MATISIFSRDGGPATEMNTPLEGRQNYVHIRKSRDLWLIPHEEAHVEDFIDARRWARGYTPSRTHPDMPDYLDKEPTKRPPEPFRRMADEGFDDVGRRVARLEHLCLHADDGVFSQGVERYADICRPRNGRFREDFIDGIDCADRMTMITSVENDPRGYPVAELFLDTYHPSGGPLVQWVIWALSQPEPNAAVLEVTFDDWSFEEATQSQAWGDAAAYTFGLVCSPELGRVTMVNSCGEVLGDRILGACATAFNTELFLEFVEEVKIAHGDGDLNRRKRASRDTMPVWLAEVLGRVKRLTGVEIGVAVCDIGYGMHHKNAERAVEICAPSIIELCRWCMEYPLHDPAEVTEVLTRTLRETGARVNIEYPELLCFAVIETRCADWRQTPPPYRISAREAARCVPGDDGNEATSSLRVLLGKQGSACHQMIIGCQNKKQQAKRWSWKLGDDGAHRGQFPCRLGVMPKCIARDKPFMAVMETAQTLTRSGDTHGHAIVVHYTPPGTLTVFEPTASRVVATGLNNVNNARVRELCGKLKPSRLVVVNGRQGDDENSCLVTCLVWLGNLDRSC